MIPNQYVDIQQYGKGLSKGATILLSMIEVLESSGLYEKSVGIYVILLGNLYERSVVSNALRTWPKVRVIYESSDIYEYEWSTLTRLRKYAHKASNATRILYMHTKGSSRYIRYKDDPVPEAVDDWRNYMMYFLVERHDICIRALTMLGYATCGVLLKDAHMKRKSAAHYSGNFWWSSAGWVKTSGDMEKVNWEDATRHTTETYILGSIISSNEIERDHLCVHNLFHNMYQYRTPRSSYIGDQIHINYGDHFANSN